MNAALRLSLTAFTVCAAAFSAAVSAAPCADTCGNADWFALNAIALKVSYPGMPGYAIWRGQYDSQSNDFQLDTEMSDGIATHRGTILMVGGLVMAARGDMVKPGLEFELLDGAALSQQLVYRLLSAALPDGPDTLARNVKIDYASDELGLQLTTPTSQRAISAPWRVTGSLKRDNGGAIEYDLQLQSGDAVAHAGSAYNPHLSGRLYRLAARLDDATSLQGWRTYDPGEQVAANEHAGNASEGGGYGMAGLHTVADARRKITGDGSSDPEAVVDFTGFWKEKCEDEFGLRIFRVETERRYVIAFCSPGGCEDADSARRSFIAGDANYEVIGENELIQTGEQGGRQRYRRCVALKN